MNPTQIRIVPTSSDVVDNLSTREDFVAVPGMTPEVGDKNAGGARQDIAVVGECDRFDLSDSGDRKRYAELSAKMFSGSDCIRLWEERVHNNGSIIIFVSYINYTNVFQSSASTINLKDKI